MPIADRCASRVNHFELRRARTRPRPGSPRRRPRRGRTSGLRPRRARDGEARCPTAGSGPSHLRVGVAIHRSDSGRLSWCAVPWRCETAISSSWESRCTVPGGRPDERVHEPHPGSPRRQRAAAGSRSGPPRPAESPAPAAGARRRGRTRRPDEVVAKPTTRTSVSAYLSSPRARAGDAGVVGAGHHLEPFLDPGSGIWRSSRIMSPRPGACPAPGWRGSARWA